MKRILNILFPALMVAGLIVSAFLIYTSLQASATPPESTSPQQISLTQEQLAEQGRTLFVAKGCIVCHVNRNVTTTRPGGFSFDDVPDLTNVRVDAEYVRRWLRDPRAMKPGTQMPNLNLSESEIEALAVFLTTQTAK